MSELEKAAREFRDRCYESNIKGGLDYPFDGTDMTNAFVAGAEWQVKQSPWISVEERLPDTDNGQSLYEVLVKMNDGRCYVAANIDVERLAEIGEVTHWILILE
ncbi:hypothetical protein [Bacteroides neonati]|uniref:hypothetical protein n=1 Tax=Bacteroides neonati TaxID=1347393 RepID=UPI0004B60DCB|nr:hypothetical protein [Bacteroides neonati]